MKPKDLTEVQWPTLKRVRQIECENTRPKGAVPTAPLPMIGCIFRQLPLRFALMLILSWTFYTAAAGACMLCFRYPQTSLADNLLQSKAVIMARERSDKAYTFYAVEVLKGAADGTDFNTLVNSTARRMLKQNAGDVVLFRREHAESDWQYVAYADVESQKFIRAIFENAKRWKQDKSNQLRVNFFAEYLDHNHRLISEQAYIEVGRAPYALIKRIADTIERQRIYEFLTNWQFIEWHNFYILILGQSRHLDDHAYIRRNLESAAAHGIEKNLSAWVAAFIETNPVTGIEEIEELYFSRGDRTPGELQEVFKGLSVLGAEGGLRAAPELIYRQHRIVHSYGTLLEHYPLMAGQVAKDLMLWKMRALTGQLTQIKETEAALDLGSKMTITHYLSISKSFPCVESFK